MLQGLKIASAIPQEVNENSCELTILMPCLNEAETIETCIRKARDFLARNGINGEILVADNGSTDGSREIALRAGARVVEVAERGYGSALLGGIRAARGRFVIMGDADDSYDFGKLEEFVDRLRQGDEFVMGNRFKGGISPGAMPLLHRYLGTPALTTIGRVFFGSPCRDFQCGLRGFRRDSILTLGLQATGMEFASEMVVKAAINRLRVSEVPTTLSPDGRQRRPHLRTWRDGWRNLVFLLTLSPRWLFLYPGLALMALGIAGMGWLLPEPREVFRITFDLHTLVYAGAAIVCGFQSVALALLATITGIKAGLFPEDDRVSRLAAALKLEHCIAAGLFLVGTGLAASAYAVGLWGAVAFGPLDLSVTMRIVIAAATLVMLGFQVVFSGFFLVLLGYDRR